MAAAVDPADHGIKNEVNVGMALSAIKCAEKPLMRSPRAPFAERGALRVFVPGASFLGNLRDSALALTSRTGSKSSLPPNYFFRGANVARVNFAARHLGTSFVLHCAMLAFLIYLPRAIPAKASPLLANRLHVEKIYYRVPRVDPGQIPRVAPAGPGGAPGSGSVETLPPILGSTATHPNLTIVSKPARPDNFRQTIYQPTSPPDLKITTELKLPNIVMGHPLEKPKPQFNPSDAKPTQSPRKSSAIEAPVISLNANPTDAVLPLPKSTSAHPLMPIPTTGGGAPIQGHRSSEESGSGEATAGGESLLVIGVDPSGPTDQISIPGGNRWGEFSIAPPGGTVGSPGGSPGGIVGGGRGGEGSGGDGSTGIGTGSSGGGGGSSGPPGTISVSGNGTGGGRGGMLDSALLNSMVYAVSAPPLNFRKNSLVVSAGPIGGGGLNVYGALSCGKIYSVFLPMPGKNWSLQYCVKKSRPQGMSSESRSTVIHLDMPVLPPDADLTHRFDFKRIPVAVEKSHRAIVLKGVIDEDGSVQQLVVYQGVLAEMDEAARLAFSRWQFKPAMRDGKPVQVEVLVGIPPFEGEDRVNR